MMNYQDNPIYKSINASREKFKPENIKILFIAEAPPDTIDRFFYYPDIDSNDWLYLGIVKALCSYPNFTDMDKIDIKKLREYKKDILKLIKDDGFYLMDLSPLPKSLIDDPKLFKSDLINRLKNETAIDKTATKIILIKVNVYNCLFDSIKGLGYAVQSQRIPFPASGQQRKFAIEMEKALKAINYQPGEGVKKAKSLIWA